MPRRRYWSRCQSHGLASIRSKPCIPSCNLTCRRMMYTQQQQEWSATGLEKLQDKLTELESELRDVVETLNIARDELSRVEKEMARHEQQQSTITAAGTSSPQTQQCVHNGLKPRSVNTISRLNCTRFGRTNVSVCRR
eukprot:PhF_6_TR25512/c1_g2_i4/m.35600